MRERLVVSNKLTASSIKKKKKSMTKPSEYYNQRKYFLLLLICCLQLLVSINYGLLDAYYPKIGETNWFRIITLLLYTPLYITVLFAIKTELVMHSHRSSLNWLIMIIIIGDILIAAIKIFVILSNVDYLTLLIDTLSFFTLVFWILTNIIILFTKFKENEFIYLKIFALASLFVNVYVNIIAEIGEYNLHSIVIQNPIDYYIQLIPFVFVIVFYYKKYQKKIEMPAANKNYNACRG